GLDGSNAYWYADTQNNIIDTLSANSQNGKISFCNPDSEALNYTDLQLNPDAQEQLTVANASGEIFWFSSDAEIATVDENGVVTAISSGECQIQAFVNNHILACNVTVLDSYHYSVAKDEEIVITSTETTFVLEYPDAAETVTWISANPDIVTVDSNGTLHAVKEGTANILATCNGKTYKKMITVSFATAPRSVVLAGDVDENGSVDILDVIAMNKTILGQKVLTTSQQQAADLDKNGMVDTVDSLTLMKMIVGLI
ncbi:MAG: Ig-like domain-containing protein, partial [Oscillospiraceae bacterium]|nr:Ig-like domain-containing protein [Oscillospiraceae bacterium]